MGGGRGSRVGGGEVVRGWEGECGKWREMRLR